jgi:hypothetical protein
MLGMLNAVLVVQGLHVAAALGIADELPEGPRGVEDLARAIGADPASLYRLLRMLAAVGVVREKADRQFALTTLGGSLRGEGPESVRDWALFVGAPEMWETWSGLRDSVISGEPAFPRKHGTALWDYLASHEELGETFNRWMSRQSDQHNAALVESYDFSQFHTVADIGGGMDRRLQRSSKQTRQSAASCSICRRSWRARHRSKRPESQDGSKSSAETCSRGCLPAPTRI